MSVYRALEPASRPVPVSYDEQLVPGLQAFLDLVERIPLRADTIADNRAHFATIIPSIEDQTAGRSVAWRDHTIPGPAGAPDVAVTVISPAVSHVVGTGRPRAAVLGIHGGGYVLGNRFFGTGELIDLAERFGVVGVAVEYRLAPEHPAPAAAEDCYAALCWMSEHAHELGLDPERIVVSGQSAGGGLSAAVSLIARDRGGPSLIGQLLGAPMLDDRNDTVSSWQYDDLGAWDRNNNDTGWDAALGAARGGADVHPHCAPARADDLAGLPPAYIEVGAAEVFRDESIDYARRIWAVGGSAELHVFSGAYHGFSGFSPEAAVSRAAVSARDSWWQRILNP